MFNFNHNILVKHRISIISVLYFFVIYFLIRSFLAIVIVEEDYLQGISSKILYLHVPSAWLALGIYCIIGVCAIGFLSTRNPLYDVAANSFSIIGATFTMITLITGSIWGKPTWGTWWVWDARLTSMLLLLFIYFSYIGIRQALEDSESKAATSSAAFAVIGLVNIPIIKFSVYLWSSLHQKSTFFRIDGPSIHSSMMEPIFYTLPVLVCLALIAFVIRFNAIILKNKIKRLRIAALHKYNVDRKNTASTA
jgi:heme exporter protein C